MISPRRAALSPLEAAWAVPLGLEPTVPPLVGRARMSGREALELVVRRALAREPCVVSFSGGRDSSAVLALAVQVARRDGLPDPIPATNVFPSVPSTDERAWQELVVRHLGLREWVRIELVDELDMLGEIALGVLRRHGVLAPFNSHFHVPLLRVARGGSLLTGIGGDEVFEPTRRAAINRLVVHRIAPDRYALARLARAALPRPARRRLAAGREFHAYGWLRPEARRAIVRAFGAWAADEPVSYEAALRNWWWRSRVLQCNLHAKRALAADHDVEIAHPLADPEVFVAFGAQRGRGGPPNRTWALRELFGDLLPAGLIERTTKSTFNQVFWSGRGAAFAAGWGGEGVDHAVVDVDRLREEWRRTSPDFHSFALLQQAVLASDQRSIFALDDP